MDIQHKSGDSKGEFFIQENGEVKAKVTYSRMEDRGIIIDHTEVDEELRGENIGTSLVKHAVNYARENDLKLVATCPFAKTVIKRDESLQDVLQE